jgi:hypothetical protein
LRGYDLCGPVAVAAASGPWQKKGVFGSLQKKYFLAPRKMLFFCSFCNSLANARFSQ